jgi:uncharacterized membrane protein (UPF0136 family)
LPQDSLLDNIIGNIDAGCAGIPPMEIAYYYLFAGVLSATLGLVAWRRVGSKASLIAGGISGILLLVAAALGLSGRFGAGNILGIAVCVLLAGKFIPGFLRKKTFYPDGLMAAVAVIGAVLGLIAQF